MVGKLIPFLNGQETLKGAILPLPLVVAAARSSSRRGALDWCPRATGSETRVRKGEGEGSGSDDVSLE